MNSSASKVRKTDLVYQTVVSECGQHQLQMLSYAERQQAVAVEFPHPAVEHSHRQLPGMQTNHCTNWCLNYQHQL